jgi:hypothetical protein
VTYLPNVTAAVLIEHHEGDLRCPIGQAEEIFQNLKILGKEVEFLRYPGCFHTHLTHAPSQDVDFMTRAVAWFDAHGGRAGERSASRNGASAARNGRAKASANGAKSAANGAKPATNGRAKVSTNGAAKMPTSGATAKPNRGRTTKQRLAT